jgi:DNA helicase-2/ATP-dependent DNA helicase PcrA
MSAPDLSDEQLAALDQGVALLEACPGSGKTRTVVQRFKSQASTASKGIALLSFTNAAVDEASSRCSDQPRLLKSPNFVGTFDSFIHRYIVTPAMAPILGKAPTYLESWSSLSSSTTLHAWKHGGSGIDLSRFQHDGQGGITLDVDSLNRTELNYYKGLSTDRARQELEKQGIKRIEGLISKGVFDCDSARAKALRVLRSDQGQALLTKLSCRFQEVIIDEFQDCSGIEHEIIKLLTSSGIHALVVADADQAIYEFRGATAALYDEYRATIAENSRRVLVENYRSTPAICALLSSVRTGRQSVVSAGSFTSPFPGHVFLLVGSPGEAAPKFSAMADEWMIDTNERIALAHSASDAQKLGSGIAGSPGGNALTSQILLNLGILRQKKAPSERRKAVVRLESTILSLLAWSDEMADQDKQTKLAFLEREPHWLRIVIGRLMSAGDDWSDITSCKSSIVSILQEELGSLEIGFGKSTLKQKLSQIKPDAWTFWYESRAVQMDKATLQWSTIHGAKGNEYDAVLLDIPSKKAEAAWLADEACEEKRVFYVGASRARRLLAIATPKSRLKDLKATLDSFGVKYEALTVSSAR